MEGKRIWGYVFIVISVFLMLVVLVQLPNIITTYLLFLKVFTGSFDVEKSTEYITTTVLYGLQFLLIYKLFKTGRKWSQKRLEKVKE